MSNYQEKSSQSVRIYSCALRDEKNLRFVSLAGGEKK